MQVGQFTVRYDCAHVDEIAKLQKGDILIVTDPSLMRGFDYRSKDGIALFIGKKLDSKRDLI